MSILQDLPSRLRADPSNKKAIEEATQSPFLHRAGFEFGFVNAKTLCSWLVQDLRYTQAYIRFASGLLSLVALPGSDSCSTNKTSTSVADPEHVKHVAVLQRTIDLLLGALANVRREQKFFGETVSKYHLDALYTTASEESLATGGMNEATRKYAQLFDSYAAGGSAYRHVLEPTSVAQKRAASNLDTAPETSETKSTGDEQRQQRQQQELETLYIGLVVLWATEYCYFTAWSYVRDLHEKSRPRTFTAGSLRKWLDDRPWSRAGDIEDQDHAGAALAEAFIPNWTSKEFEKFVKECEDVVNAVGELMSKEKQSIERIKKRAEKVFQEVLALEKDFWPSVD